MKMIKLCILCKELKCVLNVINCIVALMGETVNYCIKRILPQMKKSIFSRHPVDGTVVKEKLLRPRMSFTYRQIAVIYL